MEHISLSLHPIVLQALQQAAARDAVSVQQLIRDAVTHDLTRRADAQQVDKGAERRSSRLRVILGPEFEAATDWADLQMRLMRRDYHLSDERGALRLFHRLHGDVCAVDALGYPASHLTRRFAMHFPTGPHAFSNKVKARGGRAIKTLFSQSAIHQARRSA